MTCVTILLMALATGDTPPVSETSAAEAPNAKGCCATQAPKSSRTAKLAGDRAAGGMTGTGLLSLENSLQPMIERFNAAADKPRLVAILSPT